MHMRNQTVMRCVPSGTRKGDPLIINGVPMIALGDDRKQCPPCSESGDLTRLLVNYWTSGESFQVRVKAKHPIREDMPLYLYDSVERPTPGDVWLSTDPNDGEQWGMVFVLGNPRNMGWQDSLQLGQTGYGVVDAVITPPNPRRLEALQASCGDTSKIVQPELIVLQSNQVHCMSHGAMPPDRKVTIKYQPSISSVNLAMSWQAYDPEGFSSTPGNLNNGNPNVMAYNDLKSNQVSVWYGFDASVPAVVSHVRVYDVDLNSASAATQFAVDSSENGVDWTQVTIINHTYAPQGAFYQLPSATRARYWRVRAIDYENEYWALGEIEFYDAPQSDTFATEYIMGQPGTDYDVRIVNDMQTCITSYLSFPARFDVTISCG